MTETREESRSLLSLVTAEAIYDEWKREGGNGEKQTPGDFLKKVDEKSGTPHSTVENKNDHLQLAEMLEIFK